MSTWPATIDTRLTDAQRKRLAELAMLEDGWLDGYGKKPTAVALRYAAEFCVAFGPTSFAVPLESGGIEFEWSDVPTFPSIEIGPRGGVTAHVLSLATATKIEEIEER